MTPEEAVHHEWLQPSSSSSTFIITSSTSASSLMKHSRDQLKENDQSQQQMMQKYQRSQPITPLTILPQIKTPSNRGVAQRYTSNTVSGTKDSSRVKGKTSNHQSLTIINNFFFQSWQHPQVNWMQHNSNNRNSIKCISSKTSASFRRPTTVITIITTQCNTRPSRIHRHLLHHH